MRFSHQVTSKSHLENRAIPPLSADQDKGTADEWIPRDPGLIRLTGRHPFNCEPTVKRNSEAYISAPRDHYVRNHGAVPKKTWEDHRLTVSGLDTETRTFTMDDIVALPSVDVTCTLTCAGNRRKEQNMHKQTIGFSWGSNGTSCSTWTGVLLGDVLRLCGVSADRVANEEYVWLDGPEGELPKGDNGVYGTSISMLRAMDPAFDVILAYKQNGAWLTPDHGFPLRIVIPGYIGGRMIKFIERITVADRESDNFYHFMDNRVLPSHVDAEAATKEGWWFKPDFIINDLNINSALFTPDQGTVVPFQAGKSLEVTGYAYSNGNKIIRCEVSIDGCKTWRLAEVTKRTPPNKYGKHWAWVWWSIDIPHEELLGTEEIVCRAWDSSMQTQPNTFTWNAMGMMNNCVFRCKVHKEPDRRGKYAFRFEHPTVAGANAGGWMEREVQKQVDEVAVPKAQEAPPKDAKVYTMEEVERHDNAESAWFVYHGRVYDATPFLKDHPGGADSILLVAGTDATEDFDAIHSQKAKDMLKDYYIGELAAEGGVEASTPEGSDTVSPRTRANSEFSDDRIAAVALNPKKKIDFPLIEKEYITHNVLRLRFGLPTEEHRLGLPVGKHIFVYAKVGDVKETVMRAYTPTSSDHDLGYFELVVKVYRADQHPQYPAGGKMSQHMDTLEIGDTLSVKGPVGHVEYVGKGKYILNGEEKHTDAINLIAGGTGITPCFQIIKAVLRDPEDTTKVALVYANNSPDDILLAAELEDMASDPRFSLWHTVSNADDGWKYDVGYVTPSMCQKRLLPASKTAIGCVCGPPAMIKFAAMPSLESMGFRDDQMIQF